MQLDYYNKVTGLVAGTSVFYTHTRSTYTT